MKNTHILKNESRLSGSLQIGSYVLLLAIIMVSVSDAGIGRNGITRGHISRFGSIFVNDRELDISTASIIVDGVNGTQADLKLGQVVTVRGIFDDELPVGSADTVVFEENVEGQISSIDAGANRLDVLGQVVLVDVKTVFDLLSGPDKLASLNVNDQVEVSGFTMAGGEILASRIEEIAPNGLSDVTGVVNNLQASTFEINALTVEFSGAILRNFPGDQITDGDNIEAKGTMFSGPNGVLTATEIELQTAVQGTSQELGEFEGPITDFTSAQSFSFGGIAVKTDANTVFVGGGGGNLTLNTDVVVLGEFDVAGLLVADKVIIRGTRIRVEGPVYSVSTDSLTIVSLTANVDSSTKVRDRSAGHQGPFTLSDISPSDYVKARSFNDPTASTPFLAERVSRVKPKSDVRLQGFVDAISTQHFDLQGVAIDIDGNTEFTDANNDPITKTDFFNLLTIGTFVKVNGDRITGAGIAAKEIELALDN